MTEFERYVHQANIKLIEVRCKFIRECREHFFVGSVLGFCFGFSLAAGLFFSGVMA